MSSQIPIQNQPTSAPPNSSRLNPTLTSEGDRSEEWAEAIRSALDESTQLDPHPKSQEEVDNALPDQQQRSSVSTPGNELPGAWKDKPSTANPSQIYRDVTSTLSSVGQSAYNYLPTGVKNALGGSGNTDSKDDGHPILTTTNHPDAIGAGAPLPNTNRGSIDQASTTQNLTTTASQTTQTVTQKATEAAATIGAAGTAIYQKTSSVVSSRKTTLPSQEKHGQQPSSGPQGGVGALPGRSNEKGVAVLPEERVHPDPTVPRNTMMYDTSTPKSDVQGASTPTWTDTAIAARERAAQHAAATSAALGAAGAAVYGKAREAVPQSVQERFPERSTAPGGTGTGAGGKRNVDMMPVKETATLPSGDKGQGPMGGVGSLPGGRDEEGVALLPEEKAHPDPTLVDNAGAKRNIHLVSPYDTESPYSDVEANKIAAPPSAPAPIGLAGKAAHLAQSVGASGVGSKFQEADESHRFKGEEKVHQRIVTGAVDTSLSSTGGHPEKVNVQSSDQTKGGQDSASSDETRKKPSFMDKLKGEAKIFSGKLGKNEEKVEEGRALKMGVSPVSPTYTK